MGQGWDIKPSDSTASLRLRIWLDPQMDWEGTVCRSICFVLFSLSSMSMFVFSELLIQIGRGRELGTSSLIRIFLELRRQRSSIFQGQPSWRLLTPHCETKPGPALSPTFPWAGELFPGEGVGAGMPEVRPWCTAAHFSGPFQKSWSASLTEHTETGSPREGEKRATARRGQGGGKGQRIP